MYKLAQRYNHEEEFTLHLRMISALAFLPHGDVIDGFEELSDTTRELYNDTIDDLLQYFEDTYICRFRRNAPRLPPLFPIELWDMFHRTDSELPRTNNSVEGWHRSFQVHLSSPATLCFGDFCRFSKMKKTWYEYRLYNNSLDTQIHHHDSAI